MPYVIEITSDKAKMTSKGLSGPGFTPEQAAGATSMEVLGSSFSDPGPDCCTFRLLDEEGEVIEEKTINGY